MGTLARNRLTLPVLIRDEEKKSSYIFISIQLSEMHGMERLKSKVTIIQKTVSVFAEQIATF